MPVPWVTFMLDIEDVWWATVDTPRLLRCQAEWLCQLCGLELPARAWVVVEPDGEVVSGAALHRDCLTLANRWCPHLRLATYEQVEVDRTRILADDVPLDSFAAEDAIDEWGSYGDGLRRWAIAEWAELHLMQHSSSGRDTPPMLGPTTSPPMPTPAEGWI
ncbi:hypothetical protein AW168_35270 [Nocardia brasiliensis]|nr:hypothetical protein AW168_35270 [Nocardia brasiliensis]